MTKQLKSIESLRTTTYNINCSCKPNYENPRGFSIRFLLFAKLVSKPTQLILYKHIVSKLKTSLS